MVLVVVGGVASNAKSIDYSRTNLTRHSVQVTVTEGIKEYITACIFLKKNFQN